MKREVKPVGGGSRLDFQMGMGVMAEALRFTLIEIPNIDRNDPEWLDRLEKRLIGDAKGTITEGISVQSEANALKFGIDALQAILDVARYTHGLANKDGS
jgi:hypothetical protein